MDTTTPSNQFGKLGQFARRRPGIVILVVLLVLLCTLVFYGAAAVLFGKWAVGFLPGPEWTLGQFPDPDCVESEGCLARLTSAYTDLFYFLDSETVIYDAGDHLAIRSFVENKFSPQELGRIEYPQRLYGAVISPDRSHLAACFQEDDPDIARIQVLNIPSHQLLFQDVFSIEHCIAIERMDFSWDNRFLAVSYGIYAENSNSVEIWDLQLQSKQNVSGNYGAFSPDNRSMVVISNDRAVSLISLEDLRVKQAFGIRDVDKAHHARFSTFSPDGQWLAVNLSSYDKNDVIALWHLPDGMLRHQLAVPGSLRCQPVFSPDSLRLATCSNIDFGAIYLDDGPMSTIVPGGKGPLSMWQSTSDVNIISIWRLEDGMVVQRSQPPLQVLYKVFSELMARLIFPPMAPK